MIRKRSLLLLMAIILCLGPLFGPFSHSEQGINPEITGIDVLSVNGKTKIEIKSNSPFTYTIYKQVDPYHLLVDIRDTGYGVLTEKLIVDRNGVLEITPVRDDVPPNNARMEIALTVPVDIEPVYTENALTLTFDNPEADTFAEIIQEEGAHEAEYMPEEEMIIDEGMPSYAVEEVEIQSPEENQYVGEKISIDFQDAELAHVFRLIADISGYNIVVSPDVKGKFSMKLVDVPWDQALDIILRNYNLSKAVEGNIIRVAPTSVLAKEEEEIARAKESQEKAGNLVTRVYPINYADVMEIKSAIDNAKILTMRGFISVDERTSSVIIKDVDKRHTEYEALINALDVPTPQVSIDAKIVEVRNETTKELGIQWGMLWDPRNDNRVRVGGVRGLSFGGGEHVRQTGELTDVDGNFIGSPLLVNLPALVGPGKGGNIGIGYINAASTFALDMQLSALESTGKAKVISNPKITTSDNEEAKIMQGEKIPYQTISQDGTQTQFIDAVLELTVTPHITPEGTVVMNIEAKKNEADFTRQVLGVPTIAIKEVKTQVLINNNDTLVIGGIFTTDSTKNVEAVPGFAEIPVLGTLFKKKIDFEEKNELLIFITPRVVTPLRQS